ncbi:dihydrodipicolinate synthase family protein [Nakamurella antarctica]|uniref:Dihydrodipicolinate synthase family protein n=1 Tax=Nakamurella antarctica TaxID=1902245 RepID=A0A3G8ZVE8_9ACTN|nr:dihydrodipicolinate synthase family protein [Nakamurella antarctica]AZI58444.1 dihydrodipicolinate synthase family protein [Nakamurella antarctica]
MSHVLTGVAPVAPTVFAEDGSFDPAGQKRVARYLIDAGSDAICLLANYSEQFSVTDSERDAIIDHTMEEVGAEVPIMVTTSHFSARIAVERSVDAQRRGASVVMLMPPFYGATMSVDDQSVFDYFSRVADSIDIDIMVQDSPLSTTKLSVELLTRLAREIPQIRYAKIEVPRTAEKLRALTVGAGDKLPGLFDGEESITLIPDLHAGVVGTMCSAVIPDRLGGIVRAFAAGNVEGATQEWEQILPLIHYENRQCGLLAAKQLLFEGGIITSPAVRAPIQPLQDWKVRELMALATKNDALILRWAKKGGRHPSIHPQPRGRA